MSVIVTVCDCWLKLLSTHNDCWPKVRTNPTTLSLPVTIKELQNNLGVSEAVASFIMSVGTNVSKSGSALYQGMTVIFIAQVAGVALTLPQQLTVFVTALLASL